MWGNTADLKFRVAKRDLERRINHLQGNSSSAGREAYRKSRKELGHLLVHEETFWNQRAKVFWLQDGDLNTEFFHRTTIARKKRNKISKLNNDEDRWIDNQHDLCGLVHSYFNQILTAIPLIEDDIDFLAPVSTMVSEDQNGQLTKEFTMLEFTRAINQMHPDKSPGLDGFNPTFFQSSWSTIGQDVFEEGRKWLENGVFPQDLNNTNIILIPKVDTPQPVKDLRPISLCNVLYKIVSNVLSNRLKDILPNLVDKAQSAFVSGRVIQYNVLIAFEAIHSMKNKRNDRK